MTLSEGRQRYDSNLKAWVPVEPPRRATGRVSIQVDKSGEYGSVTISKDHPCTRFAKARDHRGRPVFTTMAAKRDAIAFSRDIGEPMILARDAGDE